jgi:ATP-dependent helicase/nuclease subunit A
MTIHQSKGLEFPIVFIVDFNGETRHGGDDCARWHPDADLGCTVNPPQDEDPLPFSDEGWKLANVADRIAEWKEEQRVLYVACTRAIDMLIFSAGFEVPMPISNNRHADLAQMEPNSWLMLLGSRFDLKTGEFIGTGERETKVQVWHESGDRVVESVRKPRKNSEIALPDMSRQLSS